jgi:integrase
MGVKLKERFPGQWWIYICHKGNRTAKPVGEYEAAVEAKKIIERQLALGAFQFPKRQPAKPKEPPAITVREYYAIFSRVWLESACRDSTRKRYEETFKTYILPRFGDKALKDVSRAEIKEFVATLVEKKLARATIRIIVSNFCTMFSHAIEDEIITGNPATRMPKYFRQAHVVHDEILPLSPEEVSIFLSAAIEHDQAKRYSDVPEYYPLFLCAVHTGMRSGEISGLQWGDIDWNGKFITVRRTIKDGKVHMPKTSKMRRVDMSDTLIEVLQGMRRRRREDFMKRGRSELPDWAFCNSNGSFLDMQNVKNRHFYKCLEAAKLRRIRFHDLRHTYASLLIGNGEPLAYVKDQLGHSSIKVTVDVYGHLVPGANRQAVNRLPIAEYATRTQQGRKIGKEAV